MIWTTKQPTEPGAYYVRGFNLGAKHQYEALVEVRKHDGELVCNLHESNSEPPGSRMSSWSFMSDMCEDFEWCGPLIAPKAAP